MGNFDYQEITCLRSFRIASYKFRKLAIRQKDHKTNNMSQSKTAAAFSLTDF